MSGLDGGEAGGGEEAGAMKFLGFLKLALTHLVAFGTVQAQGHELEVGDDVIELGTGEGGGGGMKKRTMRGLSNVQHSTMNIE